MHLIDALSVFGDVQISRQQPTDGSLRDGGRVLLLTEMPPGMMAWLTLKQKIE